MSELLCSIDVESPERERERERERKSIEVIIL